MIIFFAISGKPSFLTKGNIEIIEKNQIDNELVKNIFSIDGVESIFLSEDFLSVNKKEEINWENLIYIIKSYINDYYSSGKEIAIDQYKKILAESNLFLNENSFFKLKKWREESLLKVYLYQHP